MQKIIINAQKKYTVVIGKHILRNMANYLLDLCSGSKLVIITDTNVAKIYLNELVNELEQLGFKILIHIIESGEESKSLQTSNEVISFLSMNLINKFDLVVAFGGGVVCDVVGFCSAIYTGGIDYVIIPTTLLSMIDSCVGGGVALNSQWYKNQIATTHFPKGVFCDIATLSSLSKTILLDGIPEIIKLGVIADTTLLDSVMHIENDEDIIAIVARCINIKNALHSTRSKSLLHLEFGHTLAHAIETYSGYKVSHGQAVAIGISMITKVSQKMGFAKKGEYHQITTVLSHFNFRTTYDIPLESLAYLLQYDIKHQEDCINVILLDAINHLFVHKIKLSKLYDFFCALY